MPWKHSPWSWVWSSLQKSDDRATIRETHQVESVPESRIWFLVWLSVGFYALLEVYLHRSCANKMGEQIFHACKDQESACSSVCPLEHG